MDTGLPDTLVLKIVEYDSHNVDTTLYILYDYTKECYVIRGNRPETRRLQPLNYSFECESTSVLVDFIKFVIDSKNEISYILYNYDNLPSTSDEITFDFLHEYDDNAYEIAGYDRQKLRRSSLSTYLRMLKNVFNLNQ